MQIGTIGQPVFVAILKAPSLNGRRESSAPVLRVPSGKMLVINEWKGERDKIASMSKDAYELAEQGDSAAAGIFKSAARELAKIVKGVYRNGNFDIPVYVSYSGGVFKAMKYIKETLEECSCTVRKQATENKR